MLRPMSRLYPLSLLFTVATALALLSAGCGGDDGDGDTGPMIVDVPVTWEYGPGAVRLTARNFTLRLLESSSPVLRSNAQATVTGSGFTVGHDAGTLEVEWSEAGNLMRILFFFAKDDGTSRWHLNNIQHFDGLNPQGWVFYTGPLWDAALGEPFMGDVELEPDPGQPGAELRFDDVEVTAFSVELPDPTAN